MSLREPSPFPETPLRLARFLATSLTFTTRVRSIELWFDDYRLCKLDKSLETIQPLAMPSHLNSYSPEKMMRVNRLESQGMRIDVDAIGLIWEGEREKIQAEREKANRPSLTAALTRSGGITSMLQSAFGGRSSRGSPAPTPRESPRQAVVEDELQRSARLLASYSAKAMLRVATSHVDVKTDAQFKREIERSTKKPPPTKTAVSLIWVGKEEYDASGMDTQDSPTEEIGPSIIFEGLMPRLGKQGNVFIGFRTHQTTGFAGHVAARFIPTVERESIDFIDRHCARWNMELLAVGGFTCRAIYETEMDLIKKAWTEGDDEPSKTIRDRLLDRALHTMRFFTMRDSSPSPRVFSTFLETFFSSSRQNLLTLASTQGVKTSSLVRLPNAVLLEFIKRLPVIPANHIELAGDFFDQVRARNLVKDITMEDVFSELGSRALLTEEMISCLRWWINVSAHPGYDARLRSRLLDVSILEVKGVEGKEDSVQPLSSVHSFLNPQRIPSDVPLPVSCLAYEVSKAFSAAELSRVYDWHELSTPVWLSHLATISTRTAESTDVNIQVSPAFSEKVIGIVARSWGNLSNKQQQDVATILADLTCLPTRKGMQKPADSYFANVSLFDDLSVLAFPTLPVKGNVEKLLIALKVRQHVDLQLIFTRLVGGGDWSHVELLTYLASNKEHFSSLEIDRLKKTPIWPKEGEAGPLGKDGKPKTVRYRANQLYEPVESLRGLGLPILDWTTQGVAKPWRSSSEEAKFATLLGLQRLPPVLTILELAASTDEEIRSKALAYFLEKASYRDQYTIAIGQNLAFVPCKVFTEGKPATLTRLKPQEVFTNPAVEAMGFAVVAGLSPSDVPKLGLRSDPPASMLISKLVNNPSPTLEKARSVFEYLASVQTFFSGHDVSVLQQAAFVPIPGKPEGSAATEGKIRHVVPTSCYFGGNDTVEAFRSVFLYIPDLGAQANSFLRLVGVSAEPSIEEVASKLVAEPTRFYNLSGSVEAYQSLLRQIATNWNKIRQPLRNSMKYSAFLLGSKRVKSGGPSSVAPVTTAATKDLLGDDPDEETEDAGMLVHSLKRPAEVVIVDDANAGMIFGSSLFFAPHEDLLGGLYSSLGSPKLSSLIEERYATAGPVSTDTQQTNVVKAVVLERTPLFLFECRQNGNKGDIRRDADWLKASLDVVEVGGQGLRLSRTLRFGNLQEQDVQKSSAMAQMEGKRVKLFIASNTAIDWFEVASSLNRFLLSRQRLQEVLLFMTLLSTSLRDLKRRGFHVDKILQQRKAERDVYERSKAEKQLKAQLEALSRPSESQIEEWKQQVLAVFPDADSSHVTNLLKSKKDNHLQETTDEMLRNGYVRSRKTIGSDDKTRGGSSFEEKPPGAFDSGSSRPSSGTSPASGNGDGFFSSWKSRFKRPEGPSSLASGTSSIAGPPTIMNAAGREAGDTLGQAGPSISAPSGLSKKPAEQPSSLDSIRRNVLSAISASRPETSSSIQSSAQATQVKEANSSYCDNSGIATDLTLAGEVAGMKVYLSSHLDPAETMIRNRDALERLIVKIYRPIGAIFGIDPKALHVFIDTSGPTIAFNRAGTIWLNLRYYLAWHDEAVQKGLMTEALISTYFSVAHEIAHNLEQQHNAQHEFYTSALCEEFFMSLARFIGECEKKQ